MNKKVSGIIAIVLALAVVIAGGVYSSDARLKASDENVYGDAPETSEPSVEVQEVIVEAPAEEPAEEPAGQPEETDAEVPAEEAAEEVLTEELAEESEEISEEETDAEAAEEVPEEETDEEEPEELELYAWITTSLDGIDEVEPGTEITLYAHLQGFENLSYVIHWEYSEDDGLTWKDSNMTGETCTFALTEANDFYLWRINIMPA